MAPENANKGQPENRKNGNQNSLEQHTQIYHSAKQLRKNNISTANFF